MSATEFAPAKVNLTLHVTGQRDDGYHLLDSLVVFADVGDGVNAQAGPLSLSVTGPFAAGVPVGPENLMQKAARWLGVEAALRLDKHLPHPAGIGGGSADAAATVRALCRMTGRDLPPAAELVSLGADVPVCLSSMPQIMGGIGEAVAPVSALPPLAMVLVNPGVPTPTGAVFGRLASKDNPGMDPMPLAQGFEDFVAWLAQQRNDLEAPACALVPEVVQVLDALRAVAPLARMSGSGATCFGLFPDLDTAEHAAAALQGRGWWVRAAKVL